MQTTRSIEENDDFDWTRRELDHVSFAEKQGDEVTVAL